MRAGLRPGTGDSGDRHDTLIRHPTAYVDKITILTVEDAKSFVNSISI